MSGEGGYLSSFGNGLSAGLNYQLAQQQARDAAQWSARQAELAQENSELAHSQVDLAWDQWNTYKRTLGPVEEAAAAQAMRDMGLLGPLREAQVSEAMRDLGLYRPLKEAAVNTAVGSMRRFEPLESAVVADALEGVRADPSRAAGRAAMDVRASFAKARQGEGRKLASMGLDPARLAWMGRSSTLEEAAAEAAARTRAAESEVLRAETATREGRLAALGLRRQPAMPQPFGLNAAPGGPLGDPAGNTLALLRSGQSGLASIADDSLGLARDAQRQASQHFGQFTQDVGRMFSNLDK